MTEPRHLHHLVAAHPLLFRGRFPSAMSVLPSGWYDIVDRLCSDIETVLESKGGFWIEVVQIKEKFGGLRFYYVLEPLEDLHPDLQSGPSDPDAVAARIRALVRAAQAASDTACEACGALAELRNVRGWWSTLCEAHLAVRRGEPIDGEGS